MPSVTEAVRLMRYYCDEANLGYCQQHRQDIYPGGEADCSSLVLFCLRKAGFDCGSASYTGNMRSNLVAHGWRVCSVDGHPRTGDVLLNDGRHVAMCTGPGILSQASINELGRANGGRPGDQTGRETNTRSYYDYPWDCYLRWQGADSGAPSGGSSGGAIEVDGYWGSATTLRLQEVLGAPYRDGVISRQNAQWRAQMPGLTVGWEWVAGGEEPGSQTMRLFQRNLGVVADGFMGPATANAMIARYGNGITDGRLDEASPAIKGLQAALNEGRL